MITLLNLIFRCYFLGLTVGNQQAACQAVRVETVALPAEMLLAVAWIESRFTLDSVSKIEQGQRTTGQTSAGQLARSHGPFFCGPLQSAAGLSRSACSAMQSAKGWQVGAAEIQVWLKTCRGDWRCALSGHGCGNAGAKAKRCGRSDYASRALILADKVREKFLAYLAIPKPDRGTARNW
jgi:hypothetical protein